MAALVHAPGHRLRGRPVPAELQTKTDNVEPADNTAEPRLQLMSLPTELHIAISQQLIYPDALSLKHTSRYFRDLVRTGVALKIEWLLDRRRLHLECPNSHKCDLGSDLRFCRGSVPMLMRRRRQHFECETRPGLGCLVYGTLKCAHRPKQLGRWSDWFRTKLTIELWWIILAVLPLLGLFIWSSPFSNEHRERHNSPRGI